MSKKRTYTLRIGEHAASGLTTMTASRRAEGAFIAGVPYVVTSDDELSPVVDFGGGAKGPIDAGAYQMYVADLRREQGEAFGVFPGETKP